MQVVLTSELDAFVKAKVAEGRYVDESEVVRDALRELEMQQPYESPELEAMLLEGLESGTALRGPESINEIRNLAHCRKW